MRVWEAKLDAQMNFSTENPFFGPVPGTIPLPRTPLTAVLAQIRFPEILSVAKAEFVSDFQEEIRQDYPICASSTEHLFEVRPSAVNQSLSQNWRFNDSTGLWRTTLASGFFALETRGYSSREDFVARVAQLANALSNTVKPNSTTRIGIRYVDRVHGESLDALERFVRPEVLGPCNEPLRENIEQVWTQLTAMTDHGKLTARWGHMPRGMTHEPDLMPPIEESCWFLDTDAYMEFSEPRQFESTYIADKLDQLASRSYGFFRWAVSDEFLRHCGGRT